MYYYNNYNNDYGWSNDYDNQDFQSNHNKQKQMCCVKKVYETVCCYPSYYGDNDYDHNDNCRHEEKKNCCKKEERCNNSQRQRNCCFCNLFRNWR